MTRRFELVIVEGGRVTHSVPFRFPLLAWQFALGWAGSHYDVVPPELTNAAHSSPPLIGSVKLSSGSTYTVQVKEAA